MKIIGVRTSGGFSQGEEEPSISFIFDHQVKNEDQGEVQVAATARSIVMTRHGDPNRYGWRGRLWNFFTDGYYDAKLHHLGVSRRGPAMNDAQQLWSEAEAIGDEYLKVLGQVPALLEQVQAWAERSGLKVETKASIYNAEFDVIHPTDPTVRGTVGFDIHSDPLRFDFNEEATAKLKAKFDEVLALRKAMAEEREKRHQENIPYQQRKRSNAAKEAAKTRKANQDWKVLQEQLMAQLEQQGEAAKKSP